jgi:hypothetical protein
MNSLCDGHVASRLVSNDADGSPDAFWMCFAFICAYVMAFWLCYHSKFSGCQGQLRATMTLGLR